MKKIKLIFVVVLSILLIASGSLFVFAEETGEEIMNDGGEGGGTEDAGEAADAGGSEEAGETAEGTEETGETAEGTEEAGETAEGTEETGETAEGTEETGETAEGTEETGETAEGTEETGETAEGTEETGEGTATTKTVDSIDLTVDIESVKAASSGGAEAPLATSGTEGVVARYSSFTGPVGENSVVTTYTEYRVVVFPEDGYTISPNATATIGGYPAEVAVAEDYAVIILKLDNLVDENAAETTTDTTEEGTATDTAEEGTATQAQASSTSTAPATGDAGMMPYIAMMLASAEMMVVAVRRRIKK